MAQKTVKSICYQKRGFMKEKDIKRIIKQQVKSKHPNWKRLSKAEKKIIVKEVADA
jgi:hypothetical protein